MCPQLGKTLRFNDNFNNYNKLPLNFYQAPMILKLVLWYTIVSIKFFGASYIWIFWWYQKLKIHATPVLQTEFFIFFAFVFSYMTLNIAKARLLLQPFFCYNLVVLLFEDHTWNLNHAIQKKALTKCVSICVINLKMFAPIF